MIVTPEEFAHIRRQAEAEYPNECCGVVLVREGSPGDRLLIPCRNVQDEYHARDPENYPRTSRTAYKMDGQEVLKFLRRESEGYSLRVIYHSHIDAGAYFSETDKMIAVGQSGPLAGKPLYPDATYVVLSVVEGKVAGAAAFAWDDSKQDFLPGELAELPL